jgi:hypothetical protein
MAAQAGGQLLANAKCGEDSSEHVFGSRLAGDLAEKPKCIVKTYEDDLFTDPGGEQISRVYDLVTRPTQQVKMSRIRNEKAVEVHVRGREWLDQSRLQNIKSDTGLRRYRDVLMPIQAEAFLNSTSKVRNTFVWYLIDLVYDDNVTHRRYALQYLDVIFDIAVRYIENGDNKVRIDHRPSCTLDTDLLDSVGSLSQTGSIDQ